MTLFSGRLAAVNGVSTARSWRVSQTAEVQAFVASNTKGMTGREQGNRDWNGQYSCYGHMPAHMPGEEITFLGSMDGVKGVSGAAIVDSVEIAIDIESGAIISHTVNFSGNGPLSLGVAAVVDDVTSPAIYSSIGRKVEIAPITAAGAYEEIDNVRTATIRISAKNASYVDSSTGGWVKRKPGNLEASVGLTFYSSDTDLTNLASIVPNTWKKVKVYVTATTFWLLDAVLFDSASDIVLDREAASMCGFTVNGQFSGHYLDGETPMEGELKAPDLSTFWPSA